MDMVLEGAFADPVIQSQAAFHAVMHALANPGTARDLVLPPLSGNGLSPELASLLLTLTDHDVTVWLDDSLRADQSTLDFIAFHTGAQVVTDPGKASFAFATAADRLPPLDSFNLGTQEYPDRSATIVLAVPSLTGGPDLILRGPGIKDHLHCSSAGLPRDFVSQWSANRDVFPRGVDLLLVAEGQVMGLPRSTRITEGH